MERKNYDVRRLSAYHEKKDASHNSFDTLLKEIEQRRNHSFPRIYALFAAIAVLLIGGLIFLWQSTSLKVVLAPKKITIQPQGEIITLPHEALSVRIPLADADLPFLTKKVEARARGTIVVYNASGTKAHQFVKRTRFEAADGNIYRIEKALTIPGATKQGSELVPGEVEAEVVADEPGEAYNKDLVDFTVPGLKGSPLFEKFYARSKGPLTGGFVGEEMTIDRKAIADDASFAERERALGEELRAHLPDGFLLPEVAWDVAYGMEGEAPYAEVTGWMVKRDDLDKKLASLFFEEEESKKVMLLDDSRLSLTSVSLLEDNSALRLIAEGEVVYVERIDKDRLPTVIAGLSSAEEINTFFEDLGSIESATLIFSPAIFKRIPSKPSRITIDVSL